MGTKRKPTPYRIPTAWKGDTLQQMSKKFDKSFIKALEELAQEESERWGSRHGVAPVLMNLATRNGTYFKEKRSLLRKRYYELKQEEQDQHEEEHPQVAAEFQ